MNETNRELLEQVVEKRLREVLKTDSETEDGRAAFKEAMDAVDRTLNMTKIDNSFTDSLNQLNLERTKAKDSRDDMVTRREMETKKHELEAFRFDLETKRQESDDYFRKKEARRNFWIRVAEIGAATVVAPVIGYGLKKGFAKIICTFEKDYTFTTSAGRSLGGLFRFKD